MKISAAQHPPVGIMGGSVHSYERCLDPWHKDAFPDHLRGAGRGGKRRHGWMALDAWGNPIGFFRDGEEFPEVKP